ncbi:hypothetical protein J7M23_08285 [Candidatus Sumerlaeota bacterium]|nr:hypothetical protein [Candidatus Sumerlaeota bacterium]
MPKYRYTLLGIVGFILLCFTASLWAFYYEPLSIEALTKNADVILVGQCVNKQSEFVAGHFETRVTIKVTEYLKGNLGKEVTLTTLGGEVTSPIPIGQYVTGVPQFTVGEEVLVFLSTKEQEIMKKRLEALKKGSIPEGWKKSLSRSTLATSPIVVGQWQGKFTILTDPNTGEKRVTRFRLESLGYAHNDAVARKLYALIEKTAQQSPESAEKIRNQVENILMTSGKPLPEQTTVQTQKPYDKNSKPEVIYVRKGKDNKISFVPAPRHITADELVKEKERAKQRARLDVSAKDAQSSFDTTFRTVFPRFNTLKRLSEIKREIKEHL